jgi:hypothetical protein
MLGTKASRVQRDSVEWVEPDTYLTDGSRLLRVMGSADRLRGGLALLEDCRTLETLTVTADELRVLQLELVRAPLQTS